MLAWIVTAALTAGMMNGGSSKTCLGTQFAGPNDRWAGKRFACTGESTKKPGVRGVAHRTLPCFTEIQITNLRTGKTTTAQVIDRGPYLAVPQGCNTKDEAEYKKCRKLLLKPRRGWRYVGCLDITPPVAAEIGHDGWDMVRIRYKLRSRPPDS